MTLRSIFNALFEKIKFFLNFILDYDLTYIILAIILFWVYIVFPWIVYKNFPKTKKKFKEYNIFLKILFILASLITFLMLHVMPIILFLWD